MLSTHAHAFDGWLRLVIARSPGAAYKLTNASLPASRVQVIINIRILTQ